MLPIDKWIQSSSLLVSSVHPHVIRVTFSFPLSRLCTTANSPENSDNSSSCKISMFPGLRNSGIMNQTSSVHHCTLRIGLNSRLLPWCTSSSYLSTGLRTYQSQQVHPRDFFADMIVDYNLIPNCSVKMFAGCFSVEHVVSSTSHNSMYAQPQACHNSFDMTLFCDRLMRCLTRFRLKFMDVI